MEGEFAAVPTQEGAPPCIDTVRFQAILSPGSPRFAVDETAQCRAGWDAAARPLRLALRHRGLRAIFSPDSS